MNRIAKLVGLSGVLASGEASLFAEGSPPGHFFRFAFFTADFLALLLALLIANGEM